MFFGKSVNDSSSGFHSRSDHEDDFDPNENWVFSIFKYFAEILFATVSAKSKLKFLQTLWKVPKKLSVIAKRELKTQRDES